MVKLNIYLETTVPNYVFNDHLPEEQKVAKKIFRMAKRGEFEGFISEVVVRELNRAPEPRRSKLQKLVSGVKVLEVTPEAKELAQKYVNAKIVPKSKFDDALHIAVASIAKVGLLVSWNLEHIVKARTKMKVAEVNKRRGYPTPVIVRPEEVI
jgi:predicted nucleic acid-binding protein